MRRLSLIFVLAIAAVSLAARKPDDPKHENHYKVDGVLNVPSLMIGFGGAHSQASFIDIVTKLTNTSSDQMVLVTKGGGEFVLPQGTFAASKGAISGMFGNTVIINPTEAKNMEFRAEGQAGFHVDAATFQLTGAYTAPVKGSALAVPDFALPPSKNDFASGGFSCKVVEHSQKTDLTYVQYACTYTGTGVGIIEPNKISVKAPSGQAFANLAKRAKREVVLQNDTVKFPVEVTMPITVCDMQFSTLQVAFNDAFSESPKTPLVVPAWNLTLDAAKTAEENR